MSILMVTKMDPNKELYNAGCNNSVPVNSTTLDFGGKVRYYIPEDTHSSLKADFGSDNTQRRRWKERQLFVASNMNPW